MNVITREGHTMRTRIGAVVVTMALAAGAAAAPAVKPWEGTVTMTMAHQGKSVPVTYSIKGRMTRMEAPAGDQGTSSMIFDAARQMTLILMHERKTYMIMPAPRGQAAALTRTGTARPVKTGRTETILGYPCEEWTSADEHGTTEVWAAKGLGTFAPLGGMGRGPADQRPAWEAEMTRGGFFPLRVVHHPKAGDATTTMQVTAVEPKPLANDLFRPPKDYKEFKMPAGLGGMGAMGGRPGVR